MDSPESLLDAPVALGRQARAQQALAKQMLDSRIPRPFAYSDPLIAQAAADSMVRHLRVIPMNPYACISLAKIIHERLGSESIPGMIPGISEDLLWKIAYTPVYAKKTLPCGTTYEGYYVMGKKNGKGKEIGPKVYQWRVVGWDMGRSIYEGDFVEDKKHGKGIERGEWDFYLEGEQEQEKGHTDIHVYEGDFVHGMKTGKGKRMISFKNPDGSVEEGDIYEGDWVDGEKHGKGRETNPCGYSYEGDFENDEEHGFGKEAWPSLPSGEAGRVLTYEGNFVEGFGNGKGKQVYNCGTIYEGDIEDSEPIGYGKWTYANGNTWVGRAQDGMPIWSENAAEPPH